SIFYFCLLMITRTPMFTLFPYTTLFRSPQVKREGKTLVNRELEKFKQNSKKQTIRPYLLHLKQYIKRANSNFLSKLVIEIDDMLDRKSTRLNSSHQIISYAVFCLKKKII